MKYILIIGDGMADNPVPTLDNKTPLQHAAIPVMDGLAAKGEVGNVVNCPAGLPAGSDTAILSIFGADPTVCYTGRSPLEAAATGIQLQPGDISYRCNMVTYEDSDLPFEEKRILSHSGGSIEGDQSIQLITDLFRDPAFQQAAQQAGMVVHPAASFRHIAVQSGASITGISLLPPHDHLGEVIGPLLPSGNDNAQVLKSLMKLAHQILDHHPINEQRRAEGKRPANGVWFWAEGSAVALESFWEKYHKTGTVISAVPLCFGIARLSGLDIREVPGATGELDTNYEGKVAAALEDRRHLRGARPGRRRDLRRARPDRTGRFPGLRGATPRQGTRRGRQAREASLAATSSPHEQVIGPRRGPRARASGRKDRRTSG